MAIYAVRAQDVNIRRGSASGGVFTVLAQEFIQRGGVVFGAGFETHTWKVVHHRAETVCDLDDLRGSKYVQSEIGDTFKETKKLLKEGRNVLYSGCPCQIAALKSFLGKPYENLFSVDLICHGVPSPLAWEKYLDDRIHEANGSPVKRILPRRYCDWQDFSLTIEFAGAEAKKYSQTCAKDPFMLSFGFWFMLRECCYRCRFKSFRSGADISLGDYSGRFLLDKRICDSSGTSVVFCNTEKGKVWLDTVESNITTRTTSLSDVSRSNPCVYRSTARPHRRKFFYESLAGSCFQDAVNWTFSRRESFCHHILWWMKRLVVNHEFNELQWR